MGAIVLQFATRMQGRSGEYHTKLCLCIVDSLFPLA